MRYWRDPDTGDVIKSNADAPADPGDVVVIHEADWRRLVELAKRNLPQFPCERECASCREDAEIKAIIQRTEGANDA